MGSKPDYHVHMPNGDGYWMKLGAAWIKHTDEGAEYISIKIDALPLHFDGNITLHKPREEATRPLNPAQQRAAAGKKRSKTKSHSRK